MGCPNLSYNNLHDIINSTALKTPVHSSQVEMILMKSMHRTKVAFQAGIILLLI